MDLDGGDCGTGDSVAECVAGVGEGTGIEKEPFAPGVLPGFNPVDEGTLMVGLERVDSETFAVCLGFEHLDDLFEREGPVNRGFTSAEPSEIWTVEDTDHSHGVTLVKLAGWVEI